MSGRNLFEVDIPARVWQKYTGEVSNMTAVVEITKEFVKRVNETTEGKVYFYIGNEGSISIGYNTGYFNAKDILEEIINNHVNEQIKKGNYERISEDTILIKEPITPENVDLAEFEEVVKKIKKKIELKERKEQRLRELKERLENLLKEKVDSYVIHGVYITVVVEGCSFEIPYKDYEDAIKKVEKIDPKKEVIKRLKDEIKTLKEKYDLLSNFVKERELKDEFLEFLKEKKEEEIEEQLTAEFTEIFDDP